MGSVPFFDEPCTFEIKRGIVTVEWPGGEKMAFPLDVFRVQLARANQAMDEYDSREAALIPFRREFPG